MTDGALQRAVEAGAAAMWRRQKELTDEPGNRDPSWDALSETGSIKTLYRAEARACIITFLRSLEVTEGMLDKGQHVNSEWLNDNAPIGERRYREPAKAVFDTMRDELVREMEKAEIPG